ncbi:hypothetical protein HYS47_03225 [Candidatus Woesearchaeota archaeon]|nr:hypothetical protein [Candidatus Woesearchaeota archaeon]
MTRDLEKVVKKKVQPIVESSLHKLLGVTIGELSDDITEKLEKHPLLDMVIDTNIPFKQAKQQFKRGYIKKLLQLNYGNVSGAARIADIDRRSVHRFVKKGDIDVRNIRKEMARAYEIKQAAVGSIIQDVLEHYKSVLHPEKLNEVYHHVPDVSRDILGHLPEQPQSLKDAEEEFEREYFKKALAEHNSNVSKTAKKIGLRYETLYRKAKRLGLLD